MTKIAMEAIGEPWTLDSVKELNESMEYSIYCMTAYIDKLFSYDIVDSYEDMIICYNYGIGHLIRKDELPTETKEYILAVRRLSGLMGVEI